MPSHRRVSWATCPLDDTAISQSFRSDQRTMLIMCHRELREMTRVSRLKSVISSSPSSGLGQGTMARATIAGRKSKAKSSSRGKAKDTRDTPARDGINGNKRKEEEEDEDEVDQEEEEVDAIDSVDNSDDSDYQEAGDDSIGETDEDLDDSDSDFETSAKRKQKKSLPHPPNTPARNDSGQHKRGTGSNNQGANSSEVLSTATADEAAGAATKAVRHATAGEEAGPSSDANGKAALGMAVEKETMMYVWEIAKTSRAMCRRCDEKISKGALKIGVVTEGTWGPSTQWHHLQCTVFRITRPEDIIGFSDLDDALQPLLEEQVLKSQGMVDDMYEPITPDDLVRKEWSEKAQCPHEIMATLLPYQAEGLAWMLNQEKLDYKGGILADEMGMGKTLQAICTIVANRPNSMDKTMQQRWEKAEMDMGGEGASSKRRGGTLVVCPTIALKQWQSELARFVKPGVLKVVIHHGPNRATSAEDLMKADVILTTYAIVENEHRKAFASDKIACPDCGRSLYPDKMFVHRKYFCGADAHMTEAQAKTQRKGRMAPWRRNDPKEKAKGKVKTGVIDTDSEDDDMTEVKRRGRRDKKDHGGTTKVNVRVKATKGNMKARPNRSKNASSARKAKDDSSGEDDSGGEAQTDVSRKPASKRRKSAAGGVSKGKGGGGGRRDLEGTTDVSDRGKKGRRRVGGRGKGKVRKAAKGKGVKRKRAAGESESEWSDGTESSDEDPGNSKDGLKEEAFAKVLRAMMARKKDAEPGVLQEISWQRIMLDEAHMIKDRSTSTAKAVFALTSLFKWCLTGTPLQNRVGELYSLVRFLRMDPHAYYNCRKSGCDCKSLNYRFGPEWRACEECGHTPMMHFAYFNRHILNPISRTGYVGEGKKAFLRLKHEVLDQILLRRTKVNRSSDICLPPRIVRVRQHRLDEREEDFYQALYTQSQAQFDTYVDSGTILNNYAHIFDILIRLRQAVDHPYLVIYSSTKREGMTPAITSPTPPLPNGTPRRLGKERSNEPLGETSSDSDEEGDGGEDCGICSEPAERPVSAACGHSFCRACVQELIETAPGDIKCPSCSEPLTVDLSGDNDNSNSNSDGQGGPARAVTDNSGRRTGRGSRRGCGGSGGGTKDRVAKMVAKLEASVGRNKGAEKTTTTSPSVGVFGSKRFVTKHSVMNRIDLSKFQSSTKMEALMEEVHIMQDRDPAAKAIVFSQFVNMLDLIEYRMHKGQVGCRKLSGHLSVDQRDQVLRAFQNDPRVKVLLISLKAGGVALNLTVANHIFLMDPWWNPAAEMQAIDRTHRLGQFKPIYATRFIIEDTVEERIIKLQEKKQLVFDSTVGGSAESTGKLTVDDLRFLFAH